MTKKLSALFVLFSLVTVGCPRQPVMNPVPVLDVDMCPAACSHLRDLKCKEGEPITMATEVCAGPSQCPAKGSSCVDGHCVASCETFCQDVELAGVWLDPMCVSSVKTCGEIDRCPLTSARRRVVR